MRVRKETLCGGIVLAASFVVQGPGTTRSHFVANGDHATIFFTQPDPESPNFVSVVVAVRKEGTQPDSRVLLNYLIVRCPVEECHIVEGGIGSIPNTDLTGDGNQVLRLDTNTEGNPDFHFFAGTGGPLIIEWRSTDVLSQSFRGTSELFIAEGIPGAGSFSERTNGATATHWATASGSVHGFSVPAVGQYGAYMGIDHQVTIDVCGPGLVCQ